MTEPLYRWLTPSQIERIREYGILDFLPGENAAPKGIGALAWQLRSGALALENGRVVIVESMMPGGEISDPPRGQVSFPWPRRTSSPEKVRALVQARADAINRIIDQADLHPADLEELKNIFNELENKEND